METNLVRVGNSKIGCKEILRDGSEKLWRLVSK